MTTRSQQLRATLSLLVVLVIVGAVIVLAVSMHA